MEATQSDFEPLAIIQAEVNASTTTANLQPSLALTEAEDDSVSISPRTEVSDRASNVLADDLAVSESASHSLSSSSPLASPSCVPPRIKKSQISASDSHSSDFESPNTPSSSSDQSWVEFCKPLLRAGSCDRISKNLDLTKQIQSRNFPVTQSSNTRHEVSNGHECSRLEQKFVI